MINGIKSTILKGKLLFFKEKMPLIRDNRRTDRRDSRQDDRQVCDCKRIWSIDLCLILILGRSY